MEVISSLFWGAQFSATQASQIGRNARGPRDSACHKVAWERAVPRVDPRWELAAASAPKGGAAGRGGLGSRDRGGLGGGVHEPHDRLAP